MSTMYSVWTSLKALAESADRRWGALEVSVDNPAHYSTSIDSWNRISEGNRFYGNGGTKAVIKRMFGEHSRNSTIIANMEKSLLANNFQRKKFVVKPRQRFGSVVDIPRYLSGDQRCWFAAKREKRPYVALRVYSPMGGTSEITKKEMSVCGALSCAVVEMLESNGINVELWASCVCKGVYDDSRTDDLCTLIRIKDMDQYCDYGMIDYVTGESEFYRNIVFKDRIVHGAKFGKNVTYGGGISRSFTEDLIPEDEQKGDSIVIPRIYKIENAKEWLNKNMEKIIGKANDIIENGGTM